jgi:CubicO group peptidase (beta-lactamase class C family)
VQVCIFPPSSPDQVGVEPRRLAAFEAALPAWVEAGEVVGAELLVIARKRTVLHLTAGWKDRERRIPMRPETIFRIRSMTKPFTGTLALMLAEQGVLELEDPVARWLPSFDHAGSRGVTIEHLLRHVAGFDHPGFPAPITRYGSLRGAADAVGRAGPGAEPGSRYCYSDAGSACLGALVAEAGKAPLEELMRERILEPLGMADTLCVLRHEEPRRLRVSCSYKLTDRGFEKYWDIMKPPMLDFLAGAGGLYSTPRDFARFLACWMHGGGGLLSPQSVERALSVTPMSREAAAHGAYGMQWYLYSEADAHDDSVLQVFGHDGSDGTWGMAIPKLDLMVLYFSQSRGGGTLWKVMDLVRGLVEGSRPA